MKVINLILAAGVCLPAMAQTGRIDGGGQNARTFGLYWETRLEPPTPVLPDGFSTKTVKNNSTTFGLQRVMLDRSRRSYFGYQVTVEPLPDSNTFRVTFGPLSMTPEVSRIIQTENSGMWAAWSGWIPDARAASSFPPAQTVRAGDVIALDLLTHGETGQKIVDYVTIQEPQLGTGTFNPDPLRDFSYVAGSPRDFTVDEAPLRIKAPRLRINGKLDETSTRYNLEVAGAAIWFYTANRGRFILSLAPNRALGFRKAGEVRGSSLTFTIGADTFTIESASRIATGEWPYNLYVLPDPTWRPTYANANQSAFNMGAADRAEWLVRGGTR
jgi:hypothetical protein